MHPEDHPTAPWIPWCVNTSVSTPQKMNYKYSRWTESLRRHDPRWTKEKKFLTSPRDTDAFHPAPFTTQVVFLQIARLPSFHIPQYVCFIKLFLNELIPIFITPLAYFYICVLMLLFVQKSFLERFRDFEQEWGGKKKCFYPDAKRSKM